MFFCKKQRPVLLILVLPVRANLLSSLAAH
jgi:hypothetical protein